MKRAPPQLRKRPFVDFGDEPDAGPRELKSANDWLEWQANAFAAFLLMPEKAFKIALVRSQKLAGINRFLGRIYAGREGWRGKDLYDVVENIRSLYGVSHSVIRFHLSTLDLFIGNGVETKAPFQM